jgi:hypothetical protein
MPQLRRSPLILRVALALLLSTAVAGADTMLLKSGDRISGTVTGGAKGSYRVQTPYGRLVVPKEKIDRIVYADGREEVVGASASVLVPASPTPAPGVKVELIITGESFWQAWDPKEAPLDPALRLLILVDDQPAAAYVDRQLDNDIPGAVVNTFAFDPAGTSRTLWNDTRAETPAVTPGHVTLRMELLPNVLGSRRLRLKYQVNSATADQPVWSDLVETALAFQVSADAPTVIQVDQSRGDMSFGGVLRRKRMKNVASFILRLAVEHDGETTVIVPSK